MLKRNIAIVAIAVVVLGVGAYAWAEGAPARPTTSAPAAALAANGRPGRAGHPGLALLRRAVHGDVIVKDKAGQFVTAVDSYLLAVEGGDRRPSRLEGLPQQRRDDGQRGLHLGLRDPEVVDGDTVEPRGVLAERVVAPLAHFGQDRPDRLDRRRRSGVGPGQLRPQVTLGSAQVEPLQHGEAMVIG